MRIAAFIGALFLFACSAEQDQSVEVLSADISPNPDVSSDSRPNIILIVADDLGYTDIEPFGGEIETPTLTAMADQGIRFSRFYTSNTCAPTRTMLMSGVDNHLAGYGSQGNAPNQEGQPGYENFMNFNVLTMPELLKEAGYHTYMVGKWHLGHELSQLPVSRGFDESFVLMQGGASYFDDMTPPPGRGKASYFHNATKIESLPEDFYATHYYTDRAIEQIDANIEDGKPFFSYLAYTSPHWPLHAPESKIDKYKGQYDEGFNKLKLERFAAVKNKGLIPADAVMSTDNPETDQWDELSADEKAVNARAMEVYAAMVDDLDSEIGRVVEYLEEKGEYENTLFIFFSDNGADPTSDRAGVTAMMRVAARFDNSPENLGRKGSWYPYGHNWAEASTAAFSLYKSEAAEGGVRVPAIVHWPGVTDGAEINHSLVSVTDVLPTALELAGHSYPENEETDQVIHEPQGKSLVPVLKGVSQSVRDADEYLGIEHWSSRAIIQQDWKIRGLYTGIEGRKSWELFNISVDPGETNNLADSNPEKLQELMVLWDEYVEENNVILAEPGVPTLMPNADDSVIR